MKSSRYIMGTGYILLIFVFCLHTFLFYRELEIIDIMQFGGLMFLGGNLVISYISKSTMYVFGSYALYYVEKNAVVRLFLFIIGIFLLGGAMGFGYSLTGLE